MTSPNSPLFAVAFPDLSRVELDSLVGATAFILGDAPFPFKDVAVRTEAAVQAGRGAVHVRVLVVAGRDAGVSAFLVYHVCWARLGC